MKPVILNLNHFSVEWAPKEHLDIVASQWKQYGIED
jgi:hypothetical protein